MLTYYLAGIPASFKSTTLYSMLVTSMDEVLLLERYADNLHDRSLEDPAAYNVERLLADLESKPGIRAIEGNAVIPEVALLAEHRLWFNPSVERIKRNYSYRAHGHRPHYDPWYGVMVEDRMETFLRLNQQHIDDLGFVRIGTTFEGDNSYEQHLAAVDVPLEHKVNMLIQVVRELVKKVPETDIPRFQHLVDRHEIGFRRAPYTNYFFPKLVAELDAAGIPHLDAPEIRDPDEEIAEGLEHTEVEAQQIRAAEVAQVENPPDEVLRELGLLDDSSSAGQ